MGEHWTEWCLNGRYVEREHGQPNPHFLPEQAMEFTNTSTESKSTARKLSLAKR